MTTTVASVSGVRACAAWPTQSGGPLEERSSPEEAAALLATLTLATGWRVIVVDGCERWREEDVRTHLASLPTAVPPESTIAFFALEDGRLKAPALLHELVKRAGGDVAGETAVKEWDLPKWTIARGAEKGLTLDMAAARALVHATGPRQARLDRELEKLATELGPGARVERGHRHRADRARGGAQGLDARRRACRPRSARARCACISSSATRASASSHSATG